MAYGVDFVLVLVDAWEPERPYLQDMLVSGKMKVQVVRKGQMVVGVRHGPSRPTVIVDLIKDRTFEGDEKRFTDWYGQCILPAGGPYTQIIKG